MVSSSDPDVKMERGKKVAASKNEFSDLKII